MFRKKKNPENPDRLAQLLPQRRFTHEEVASFVEMARGLVNDGLPILWISPIQETPLYYHVEVTYDDGTIEHSSEVWYFYKQYIAGEEKE